MAAARRGVSRHRSSPAGPLAHPGTRRPRPSRALISIRGAATASRFRQTLTLPDAPVYLDPLDQARNFEMMEQDKQGGWEAVLSALRASPGPAASAATPTSAAE